MQRQLSTLATVQRIIADETDLRPEELDPARALDELGVDSLTVIEAMFKLENELSIKMPQEHVPIRTVQDIVDVVDRLIAERDARTESEPAVL